MNISYLTDKYRQKANTLLQLSINKNLSAEDQQRALACRRFVVEFIRDIENIKSK